MKNDLAADIETLRAGVRRIVALAAEPEPGDPGPQPAPAGPEALAAWQASREKFDAYHAAEAQSKAELPHMIDAGFRVVGSLFLNLATLAAQSQKRK